MAPFSCGSGSGICSLTLWPTMLLNGANCRIASSTTSRPERRCFGAFSLESPKRIDNILRRHPHLRSTVVVKGEVVRPQAALQNYEVSNERFGILSTASRRSPEAIDAVLVWNALRSYEQWNGWTALADRQHRRC